MVLQCTMISSVPLIIKKLLTVLYMLDKYITSVSATVDILQLFTGVCCDDLKSKSDNRIEKVYISKWATDHQV